ncbi:MAG TPA: acyl-protein synthetase [Polyangiaceae bacterium]|nr:acyl-protein synthetase [Polyangiaceae bacterium]
MNRDREERAELHARVRAFIDASEKGETPAESFDALGLAIARHQAEHVPAYRRLVAHRNEHPRDAASVRQLPAVPTDAFRLTRIAAHPPSDDAALFRTSGTMSGTPGEHALSTTATYQAAALAWGRWALFFDAPAAMTAIALTPPRAHPLGNSSLHFMIQLFATEFARAVRYLQPWPDRLVDAAEFVEACATASRAAEPVIVMGASFAFVQVLDALGDERLALPEGSRIMHTGGFKGRSREVAPDELLSRMATTFAIPESAVVGEYGMTELSSQLYEGTLRAARGLPAPSARHGVFVAPPWLHVVAVDADKLRPVSEGEIGILRFEDLANVDSALVVQTADRGRCRGSTVELLGRLAGAPPRGCSLAVEELMGRP